MSTTNFGWTTFLFFFSCFVGSVCPPDWIKYETSCFFIDYNHITSWSVARASCQNLGADLAIIRSSKENDFIRSVAMAAPLLEVWIGLYRSDVDQNWYWVDDTPLAGEFSWWETGEPSNVDSERCVHMYNIGKWNDISCENQYRFICHLTSN